MSNSGSESDKADDKSAKKAKIQRVSVKVPPFWSDSPEIWFAQIEAQFSIAHVRTDISKFNTIVGAIESKVLGQVSDAVLNPPDENRYENLKRVIISRFSDSEQCKMRKLLSEMSLGDQKPSQLLNEMKRLGGTKITDEFLKTLWLQNLPQQVRAILSTNDVDLTPLAAMADKIMEVGQFANVYSVDSSTPSSSRPCSEIASLEKRIDQLARTIEKLQIRPSRSRSNYRSSSSRRSSTPAREKPQHEICWYHYKFGSAATKCRDPCSFSTPKN